MRAATGEDEANRRAKTFFCLSSLISPANYQRVHVVRPLVGVDRLQVHHVPHNVVFVRNAVCAQQIPETESEGEKRARGVRAGRVEREKGR